MINSDTEKAIAANEIVAPAITPSNVRALSTVEVNPNGRSAREVSTWRSTASNPKPSTVAAITASIGTKNKLERSRSTSELTRKFIEAPRRAGLATGFTPYRSRRLVGRLQGMPARAHVRVAVRARLVDLELAIALLVGAREANSWSVLRVIHDSLLPDVNRFESFGDARSGSPGRLTPYEIGNRSLICCSVSPIGELGDLQG